MNINSESSQNHVDPDFLNCKQIFQGYSPSWVAECYVFFVLLPLPCRCLGLLSEGNRCPRHKWVPPSSWPTGTQEQAPEGKGEGCSTARGGCPPPPSRLQTQAAEHSLCCVTHDKWPCFNCTYCQTSHLAEPLLRPHHTCALRDNDVFLIFFQAGLERSHFLLLFTSTLKTKQTQNPSVRNSPWAHPSLSYQTKCCAVRPNSIDFKFAFRFFLEFFLFKLWKSFMLCWWLQQVKSYNENKEFVLNSCNSSISAFLNLMTIGTYSHNLTHVHISFKFFWAIDFFQKKECYKYL